MTQPCAFVDPSSLSLPSSSLKRFPSPASTDDSNTRTDEPPRKRSRSAVTAEERKEARAHRNRIAAQNSRDRRKAQFSYLERRVAELEEENGRLRAGILTSSPSVTTSSGSDMTIERDREQQRKREEEQRERENHELRERIRTLEKGYEVVVRALAAQGNLSVASNTPTTSATSQSASNPLHSSQPVPDAQLSETLSPSSPNISSPSPASSVPHSPTSSNSTLVDSPLLFASGDSFEFPQSPVLSSTDISLDLPKQSLDLSLVNDTPTRHLARVANTAGRSVVSLQRVDGVQMVTGPFEDEATSDADITRLLAEILASPPLGSSALPSSSTSSEDAVGKEVLTKKGTRGSDDGLGQGLGMSGIHTVEWTDQVRAEMEMEKLLEMLPNVQDVAVDAILSSDVEMDFSNAPSWDGLSVF